MSTTTTPNFGLTMPTPGTAEPINVAQLNGNWTLVDTLARAIICTSSTNPSSPFAGQVIFETDTLKLKIRNTANSAWTHVGGFTTICTSSTRPASPVSNQLIWETDTNSLVIRNAANNGWFNASGIPVVASTASIATPLAGMVVYVSTEGMLRYYTGSAWNLFDANTIHKYKPTTESVTSSTTLQNDDVFVFSGLAANSAWELESFLPYDGAADPAGGLKMGFTGPAGASMFFANYGVNTGGLTQYNVVIEGLAAGTPRTVGTNGSPVTAMSCQPKGVVVIGGTSGTLTFQWAQNSSSATATRVLGGAWMKLTRIA